MDELIKRSDAIALLKTSLWGKSQREAIDELKRIPEVFLHCGDCRILERAKMALCQRCNDYGCSVLSIDEICDILDACSTKGNPEEQEVQWGI